MIWLERDDMRDDMGGDMGPYHPPYHPSYHPVGVICAHIIPLRWDDMGDDMA